jgi:hypothetical protein
MPINATKKRENATSRKDGFLITVRPPRIPVLIIPSTCNMGIEHSASLVWVKSIKYLRLNQIGLELKVKTPEQHKANRGRLIVKDLRKVHYEPRHYAKMMGSTI